MIFTFGEWVFNLFFWGGGLVWVKLPLYYLHPCHHPNSITPMLHPLPHPQTQFFFSTSCPFPSMEPFCSQHTYFFVCCLHCQPISSSLPLCQDRPRAFHLSYSFLSADGMWSGGCLENHCWKSLPWHQDTQDYSLVHFYWSPSLHRALSSPLGSLSQQRCLNLTQGDCCLNSWEQETASIGSALISL